MSKHVTAFVILAATVCALFAGCNGTEPLAWGIDVIDLPLQSAQYDPFPDIPLPDDPDFQTEAINLFSASDMQSEDGITEYAWSLLEILDSYGLLDKSRVPVQVQSWIDGWVIHYYPDGERVQIEVDGALDGLGGDWMYVYINLDGCITEVDKRLAE